MKTKHILIIVAIIIVLYLVSKKSSEHLDSSPTLSNEAIQSISSIYSNTTGTASFNNLNVTSWKGMVVMWSGTIDKIPRGWALCDGTNNTPDLRSKFVVGVGQGKDPSGISLTERKMGDQGGAEKHKLDITEMPSHTHGYNHTRADNDGWWYDSGGYRLSSNIDRTVATGGDPSGNTIPHNNMPPFYALAYIMKT